MSFDIFNASGAKIAENISLEKLDSFYKEGIIKVDDKIVEKPFEVERSVKPASHYHQTAIARDINNVKKRRS